MPPKHRKGSKFGKLWFNPAMQAASPLAILCLERVIGGGLALGAAGVVALSGLLFSYRLCRAAATQNLHKCLDARIKTSQKSGSSGGILLLELDQLNEALQLYGANRMGQLHRTIEARLRQVLAPHDELFSIADGSYAVLPGGPDLNDEAMLKLGKRLQQKIRQPIPLGHGEAVHTVSGGYCLTNRVKAPCASELIAGAREALDEAQNAGPNALRSYCDLVMKRRAARRGLLSDLDNAIARGELRAYFQPQISARTGEITGFEALVRWQHPERGLIPPMEFLPLLEQSGDISKVTELMIEQSLEALSHWHERGFDVPRIGINVSTADLLNRSLVDLVGFELDRHALSANHLSIEVLETVAAGPADKRIAQTLAALADLGCCIDLDDFGTGHASITNINRLCIERIKIDRSFITGISDNPEQQRLVGAILTMAEQLGLATVAEGIESEDERRILTKLGCSHLQGFGIGRPMAAAEAEAWIIAYTAEQRSGEPKLRSIQ